MADRPSLAQALYPNLPKDTRAVQQQQRDQDYRKQQRDALLEGLREVNRKIDARLAREGRR
jgi:hypothetical protein